MQKLPHVLSIVLVGLLALAVNGCDDQMTNQMDRVVDTGPEPPKEPVAPPTEPDVSTPEPLPPLPEGTVVFVEPRRVTSPAAGQQLQVRINIKDAADVLAYEVKVGFDPTALRYVSIENADYLPAGAFAAPPQVSANSVYLAATSVAGSAAAANGTLANANYLPAGAFAAPAQVSGNRVTLAATSLSGAASATSGTLATLKFTVVAAKASTIQLVEVILSDSAANPLAVTTRNGEVVVRASLPTDLNGDGAVNVLDLTLVARDLGKTGSPAGDVTGDGTVNVLDLVRVAQDLGKTAPAGGTQPPAGGGGTTTPPAVDPYEGMMLIEAGEFRNETGLTGEGVMETLVAW